MIEDQLKKIYINLAEQKIFDHTICRKPQGIVRNHIDFLSFSFSLLGHCANDSLEQRKDTKTKK